MSRSVFFSARLLRTGWINPVSRAILTGLRRRTIFCSPMTLCISIRYTIGEYASGIELQELPKSDKEPQGVAKSNKNRRKVSSWRIVIAAIVVAAIAKAFIVDLVIVRGESMVPTIVPGTVALVARCAYGIRLPVGERYVVRWAEPSPGDIVLVAATAGQSRRAIKRVFEVGPAFIRLEAGVMTGRGGSAEIGPSASLHINGSRFVPANRVFVVGDNKPVSLDSREYGPVPIEKIAGKVLLYSGGRFRAGSKTESSKDAADDVDR